MTLLELLAQSPLATILLTTLLGLLVGSFLNVVIYRLPLMLQREWQQQAVHRSAGGDLLHLRFALLGVHRAAPRQSLS